MNNFIKLNSSFSNGWDVWRFGYFENVPELDKWRFHNSRIWDFEILIILKEGKVLIYGDGKFSGFQIWGFPFSLSLFSRREKLRRSKKTGMAKFRNARKIGRSGKSGTHNLRF